FSGDRGWGYDGVLLWAPHHAYGGPDGFKRLVDAAHGRGLAVILDVVYNHLGPAGNYLAGYGPYFTDRYQTPWGSAVNFDGDGSDEVRRFVIDNASMWLACYHVDGLRLDAVHAIHDDSALPILEELAVAVGSLADRLGRPLWLIAESDRNDPTLVIPREAGGSGLDASWNDDFHHALHAVLTGERGGYYEDYGTLAQVARSLEQVYVYGRDFSPFRNRHHGRPAGDVSRGRFLAYLQNHDQVGNRAVGERSAALMSPGRLKIGAALVLCGPCVPMLFQGEEWAASTPFQYFTDHRHPDLGRAVSEGRRSEFSAFGWSAADIPDPQDPATRDRSVLQWAEVDAPAHQDMLSWHRELIGLRRSWPELADSTRPNTRVVVDEDAGWLQMRRGRLQVTVNLATEARRVALPAPGALLLASDQEARVENGAVVLGPDSVVVTRSE
ncbi:MAG: malto-oligosyltrehalose trehalohydrolase, partial [Actinomycetes bacterium]